MSARVLDWAFDLPVALSHAEARVLLVLARFADDDGRAKVSLDVIERAAQSVRPVVGRSISRLHHLGVLSRLSGPRGDQEYQFNLRFREVMPTSPDKAESRWGASL